MALSAIATADHAFAVSLTNHSAHSSSKQRLLSVKSSFSKSASTALSSLNTKNQLKLSANEQWRQSGSKQVRHKSAVRCQATAVPEPSGVPDFGGKLKGASEDAVPKSKRYGCAKTSMFYFYL